MASTAPKGRKQIGREILIRVQSVSVLPLTVTGETGETIGNHIDRLLNDEAMADRLPNKLVIDLNPRMERDYSDMEQ